MVACFGRILAQGTHLERITSLEREVWVFGVNSGLNLNKPRLQSLCWPV